MLVSTTTTRRRQGVTSDHVQRQARYRGRCRREHGRVVRVLACWPIASRSVIVIDRDELPDGPEPRRQIPQGRHPHLLLTAGARLLEGWFPGIIDELRAGGAVDVDICGDFYWYQAGGCQRRPASHMRGPAMSRPLLERTVRRRVETLANVVIRDETAADGLIADASGERITGSPAGRRQRARLRPRRRRHRARRAQPGVDRRARLRTAAHIGRRGRHPLRESHLPAHRLAAPRLEGGRRHRRPPHQAPRHAAAHGGRSVDRDDRRRQRRNRADRSRRHARLRPQPRFIGDRRRDGGLPAAHRARSPTASPPTSVATSSRCGGSRSGGCSSATPSAASIRSTAKA